MYLRFLAFVLVVVGSKADSHIGGKLLEGTKKRKKKEEEKKKVNSFIKLRKKKWKKDHQWQEKRLGSSESVFMDRLLMRALTLVYFTTSKLSYNIRKDGLLFIIDSKVKFVKKEKSTSTLSDMFDRKKKTMMEYEPSCFRSRESLQERRKEGGTIFSDSEEKKRKEKKEKRKERRVRVMWGEMGGKEQTLGLNSSWNNPPYKLDRRRNVETELFPDDDDDDDDDSHVEFLLLPHLGVSLRLGTFGFHQILFDSNEF
ncbi:hypothetical protein V1478_003975 [Vespula squamosa]|uniref:Uncharacterized protein n=1 Tax=Vespula squamosa TaxID=30214 RepID=A0ABD2BNC2_VESSQ